LTKDKFIEEFPQFVEDYISVEKDFENLCAIIQGFYDEAKNESGQEKWNNPTKSKEVADFIVSKTKKFSSIIFYMKKNNIDSVKLLFTQEEKSKFLRDAMFHPDKLSN